MLNIVSIIGIAIFSTAAIFAISVEIRIRNEFSKECDSMYYRTTRRD